MNKEEKDDKVVRSSRHRRREPQLPGLTRRRRTFMWWCAGAPTRRRSRRARDGEGHANRGCRATDFANNIFYYFHTLIVDTFLSIGNVAITSGTAQCSNAYTAYRCSTGVGALATGRTHQHLAESVPIFHKGYVCVFIYQKSFAKNRPPPPPTSSDDAVHGVNRVPQRGC